MQKTGTPQLCNTCGVTCSSRNKLFDHIKATGHALRVEPGAVGGADSVIDISSSKKGKKKKKGKR